MRDRVKHREVQRLYRRSAKGKAVRRRYQQSAKGIAKQREYSVRHYALHNVHVRRTRAVREAGTGMAEGRHERYWARRAACNAIWEQTTHITDIRDLEDWLGRQLVAEERDWWAIVGWTGASRFLKFKEVA